MTCGVCHPEIFQPKGTRRVFGYAVSNHPGSLARQIRMLHFIGAEYVFVDEPKGQVRHRKGFRTLKKVTRASDTIILGHATCFGRDRTEDYIDTFTGEGVEVSILNPNAAH